MSQQNNDSPSSEFEDLPFEEALDQLQEISDCLEAGEIGLDESIQHYEQGTRLLRHCLALLESAEQRVDIVTGRAKNGELQLEPFDAGASFDPNQQATRKRSPADRRATADGDTAADATANDATSDQEWEPDGQTLF